MLGQLLTIFFASYWLQVPLPVGEMAAVIVALVALNLGTLVRYRRGEPVGDLELFVQLVGDVLALSMQLYLSGGATNPFVMLYLLQVALGAILLQPRWSWMLVGLTSVCFVVLGNVHLDLIIGTGFNGSLIDSLHLQGALICFVLAAVLVTLFINRINANLRARDQRLADLRQQSAEEDHIVRIGLLASGAAHELGSPLATMSVIVNDWRGLPALAADAELAADLKDMQAQLERCRDIVSGILMSAGSARAEGTIRTTMRGFLGGLVDEWRGTRMPERFDYRDHIADDLPILSDTALRQMVFNVLDNALEASPHWLRLSASRSADAISLRVDDSGAGFAPGMLQRVGQPYNSSKGRPGRGLGLFLVVNVLRRLGGTIAVENRPQGGAAVTLTLPVAALAREPAGV